MPYAYDDQLIDAVAVRRKRLVGAFLFGANRTRMMWPDRVVTFMWSLILAVVICAVCVALAFVQSLFRAEAQREQQSAPIVSVAQP